MQQMYPGQDDQTRRMGQQPESRAYSQVGGGQGYDDDYAASGYPPESQYGAAPLERRGPAVDMGKFIGSVIATAVVAAIAGWLIAWVVQAVKCPGFDGDIEQPEGQSVHGSTTEVPGRVA